MKKRCLALLLAVVLIFSSFPMAAFAQGIEQEGGSGQANQIIEENANLEDEQGKSQDSLKEEDEQNVLENQDIETNALPTIAWAGAPVNYCDAKGVEQVCTDYTVVTSNIGRDWRSGWYVVDRDLTIDHAVLILGEVHLILTEGHTLRINGEPYWAGLIVSTDNDSLTIYGQMGGTGTLIANGGQGAAGIGGNALVLRDANNITINGGHIIATGLPGGIGGGGSRASANNIKVRSSLVLLAGEDQNHLVPIVHSDGEDLAEKLSGKQYVEVIDAQEKDNTENDGSENDGSVNEDSENKESKTNDQTEVNTKQSPTTGINTASNLSLFIGLIVLAVILAVVVIVLRKRNLSEE